MQVSVTGPADLFDLLLEFDAASGNAVISRGERTAVCRFETRDGVAACEID